MIKAAAPAGPITQAFSRLPPASAGGAALRSRRRPTPRHSPPVVATAIETLPSPATCLAATPRPRRRSPPDSSGPGDPSQAGDDGQPGLGLMQIDRDVDLGGLGGGHRPPLCGTVAVPF